MPEAEVTPDGFFQSPGCQEPPRVGVLADEWGFGIHETVEGVNQTTWLYRSVHIWVLSLHIPHHQHHCLSHRDARWPQIAVLTQLEPKRILWQINQRQRVGLGWSPGFQSLGSTIQVYPRFRNPGELCWKYLQPTFSNCSHSRNLDPNPHHLLPNPTPNSLSPTRWYWTVIWDTKAHCQHDCVRKMKRRSPWMMNLRELEPESLTQARIWPWLCLGWINWVGIFLRAAIYIFF